MSAKKLSTENKTSPEAVSGGLMVVLLFLGMFAADSLVVHLANQWFPEAIVLGTNSISRGWALIHAIGTLSLLVTFAAPFLQWYELKRPNPLTTGHWMMAYFVINVIAIWVVTRFAEQLGMGVSSWVVVVALAVVLDVVQGMVAMGLGTLKLVEA